MSTFHLPLTLISYIVLKIVGVVKSMCEENGYNSVFCVFVYFCKPQWLNLTKAYPK